MKRFQLLFLAILYSTFSFAQNQQLSLDILLPPSMCFNFLTEEKNHNAKIGYEHLLKENKSIAFTLGFFNTQKEISGTYYSNLNSPNYGLDYTGTSNYGIAKFQTLIKTYLSNSLGKNEYYWGYFFNAHLIYNIEDKHFTNGVIATTPFLAPMIGGGLTAGRVFYLTDYLFLDYTMGVGLAYSLNSDLYMPFSDDPIWGIIANSISFAINSFYTLTPSFLNVNLCYRF